MFELRSPLHCHWAAPQDSAPTAGEADAAQGAPTRGAVDLVGADQHSMVRSCDHVPWKPYVAQLR